MELQNDSKVPVALALAVQPHEGAGARIDSVSLAGSVLWLDGAPGSTSPARPVGLRFSVAQDA